MFPAPQFLPPKPTLRLFAHWSSTADQQMSSMILLKFPKSRKQDAIRLMSTLKLELKQQFEADVGLLLLYKTPCNHLKLQVSVPHRRFASLSPILVDRDSVSVYECYGIEDIQVNCSFDE